MTASEECRIESEVVAALYVAHAAELRAFLWGVLRDEHLVNDVLQSTFVKALEQGHTAREESRKAWLFRVAFHEALGCRRREATRDRATIRFAVERGSPDSGPPESGAGAVVLRAEAVEAVRRALGSLSETQRSVVELRMQQDLKFSEIAQRLGLPLGTVLGRMRAALGRLREQLEGKE